MAEKTKQETKIKTETEKKPKTKKQRKGLSEKSKKLIQRIFVGTIITIALVYAIFLFVTTNFMGNNNYVTEMVEKTTVSNTIKTTAFIVRDEEVIENTTNGTLVYSVNNGDRVRKNGVIATSYNSEQDAINMQKISDIDDKINYLKTLSDSNTSVNVGVDTVNGQLNTQLMLLLDSINKANFSTISNTESDLLSLIYRKQIITGEQGSFKDIINSLESQKSTLESNTSNALGTVTSPSAGYFVHNLDGYENSFDVENLDRITYEDFESIQHQEVDNDKYVGKVIKSVNWYIVCPITRDDQTLLSHNNGDIYIRLPFASSEEMRAKIAYTNESDNSDTIMLVLYCNYMNSSISEIRNESVDIMVSSYEGLKVPKKALHDDYCTKTVYDENDQEHVTKEKAQGVYVEYGNELKFKPVYLIYSGDDYVICNENPLGDYTYDQKTIALYDKVVVEGSDLYNGKLLN